MRTAVRMRVVSRGRLGARCLVRRRLGQERLLSFPLVTQGVRIARVLYALAMIAFGLSHFFYLNLDGPGRLAGRRGLWPGRTSPGAAYLAAGVAILIGVCARGLSAWQMGLFTLLVWVPLGSRRPHVPLPTG